MLQAEAPRPPRPPPRPQFLEHITPFPALEHFLLLLAAA